MALKNGIFSLALGALLFGLTAQAQDAHDASSVDAQEQGFRGSPQAPSYSSGRNRMPQPRPQPNRQGRYELKQVKQWVPARYEQVWVGQDCSDRSHRYVTRCEPGHYEQRKVPGHYETMEEWVWVPAPQRGHQGPVWGSVASR
jgi:hypothetical protein